MKRLILNLVLLIHLAVAPLSLADSDHEFWQDFSQTSEHTSGYSETYLPCSEITTEPLESLQKNPQSRVQHEQHEAVPDTSDCHRHYDFVIDHHKCDWIIRSSEPDP